MGQRQAARLEQARGVIREFHKNKFRHNAEAASEMEAASCFFHDEIGEQVKSALKKKMISCLRSHALSFRKWTTTNEHERWKIEK